MKISLFNNLFYGTSIASCLGISFLFLSKNEKCHHKEGLKDVLYPFLLNRGNGNCLQIDICIWNLQWDGEI